MKKLLFILIGMLVLIPAIASAHTEITSSNPASGQVVKEDLKEIIITYEGKIESLSKMTLIKDGQEIPLVSVTQKEHQLIGTLSSPLEKGSYTIQWNIAGEDGHPLKGEIPFTVEMEVKEEQTETKTPVTIKKEETKKDNTQQDQTNKETTGSSSYFKTIVTVVVTAILIIGLFVLFRKKR